MACKLTVNSAIRAPLWQSRLLQPSPQGAISFRTIYGLRRLNANQPKFPLTLNSRSYSESTPPNPFPSKKLRVWVGVILTSSIVSSSIGFLTQELWFPDLYKRFSRHQRELERDSAIYNKLKKGPKFGTRVVNIIERDELLDKIRSDITPTAGPRSYPVIIGEHGTGKSSLIQLAVESLEEPKGVIYLDVPVGNDPTSILAEAMKEALDWNPDPAIDPNEELSFNKFWRLFLRAADKYKKEYKKNPVLIIDHANRLATTQEKLLGIIQDYAKNYADRGNVTIAFVSSEGCIPLSMMENSSWSRHAKLIEVGDVSEEKALEYLKRRGLNGQQAAQVFGLVGGRMGHLKIAADDMIDKNSTIEEVRQSMYMDVEMQLHAAELLYNDRRYKEGGMVIHKLLENGSISFDAYSVLATGARIGNELLEKNVFARHHSSGMVTFQSTLMARFCEEKSACGLWGEREKIS